MITDTLNKFVDRLKEILDKPPYLIFVFIGSFFVGISLIKEYNFEQSLIFFLYAIGGVVWRHAVKDFRGRLREKYQSVAPEKFILINLWLTGIYQIVNLALVFFIVIKMLKTYTAVL